MQRPTFRPLPAALFIIFLGFLVWGTILAAHTVHQPVITSEVPAPGGVLETPSPNQVLFSIKQTASTNLTGMQVTVKTDQSILVHYEDTTSVDAPLASDQQLSPGEVDVSAVQGDLRAIGDVSKLVAGNCAKPASFASSIYVTYQGKTSPDIECLAPVSLQKYPRLQFDIETFLGEVSGDN